MVLFYFIFHELTLLGDIGVDVTLRSAVKVDFFFHEGWGNKTSHMFGCSKDTESLMSWNRNWPESSPE